VDQEDCEDRSCAKEKEEKEQEVEIPRASPALFPRSSWVYTSSDTSRNSSSTSLKLEAFKVFYYRKKSKTSLLSLAELEKLREGDDASFVLKELETRIPAGDTKVNADEEVRSADSISSKSSHSSNQLEQIDV